MESALALIGMSREGLPGLPTFYPGLGNVEEKLVNLNFQPDAHFVIFLPSEVGEGS